jgi:predicted kinase
MEAVILIGIQASGKSTFYKENFFNSHLRISNDLLKTKNREKLLLDFCRETQFSFVIDNTNVSRAVRQKYIAFAKSLSIPTIGYYFKTDLKRSLQWNENRIGKERIPEKGIMAMFKQLERPSMEEGFDKLYYVEAANGKFNIKEWKDEI